MSQYFPKKYGPFGGDSVNVDLSNYATKADIKNIAHVDTSSCALKTNLASLKTEVDKLDVDKLVPVPVDLNKLSDVVKNDVVKKIVFDKLVAKVNSIDTSGFVLKTKYDTDKSKLKNKIPDTSGLVKKTKTTEIEGKVPNVTDIARKTALTTVENKIPNISGLATKAELNAIDEKIPNITGLISKNDHDKDINKIKNNFVTNSALTSRLGNYVSYSAYNLKILFLENEVTKYSPLSRYLKFVTQAHGDLKDYQTKKLRL